MAHATLWPQESPQSKYLTHCLYKNVVEMSETYPDKLRSLTWNVNLDKKSIFVKAENIPLNIEVWYGR